MQCKEGEMMNKSKLQEKRLKYLLEEFKKDSDKYKNIKEYKGKTGYSPLAYEYSYAEKNVR